MNKLIKIIIFSKNRPMQLLALLESFYLNCFDREIADINILYKTSDDFSKAYEDIEFHFSECNFIKEDNFKMDLSKLLLFSKKPYVMFLVDDIIFKSEFALSKCCDILNNNEDCITFSLRLGDGINYCYSLNSEQKVPDFSLVEDILLFNYINFTGDWNYPFSLDGNIFKTNQFNDFFSRCSSKSPNLLESELSKMSTLSYLQNHSVACFKKSKLFNVPDNIVNSDINNRNEGNSNERFKELWESGLRIDVLKLRDLNNNSCHFPIKYSFLPR